MFERFTDRSRKVMALANQEALRRCNEYIGTEHILLGLIAEGTGVGAGVLRNVGVNLASARAQVDGLVMSGPSPMENHRLPQTPRAKMVIEFAIAEARTLDHNYVDTEHILLGILREHDGVAAQVLMNLGVKLDDFRQEVLNVLSAASDPSEPHEPMPAVPSALPFGILVRLESAFRRDPAYTDRFNRILDLAAMESRRFSHEYVGTEHLLLGLIRERTGMAVAVLQNFEINLEAAEEQMRKLVAPGTERGTWAELPQTPRARQVVKYALEEAISMKRHVDGEHLLLALLREPDGIACIILTQLGVTLDKVRRAMGEQSHPDSPQPGSGP